ncbi:sphingomyelin phosphodiesterase 4-like isoform X1 [Saccostrea echinata]|uniref:sphingomyelin phosphodiesterase 4-like isoform X1 n=1 Tax=Saccostrea echinata TaxID=191078 RepID=UPI002A816F5F|nr:sphingomyelin phosphodiesterase 4-like isoform X1 [Saccostrea echinata]
MAASMIGNQILTQVQSLNSIKPLYQRCLELEKVLKNTSTKELKNVLPYLLENIFGYGQNPGWGLDLINRSSNSQDFDNIRRLLAPEGTLLSLVYTLMTDSFYEFPINSLPTPTQHLIEDGSLPIFYANKLQYLNFGRPVIVLNAYELYMFHLAYHLVNPSVQRHNSTWNNITDSLYPVLIDDYLNFFLPLNKDSLPKMPIVQALVRSPVAHSPMAGKSFNMPTSPPSPQRPSLLKSSFVSAQKQHAQTAAVISQGETTETYRSDTLIQVFAEFWLNQNPISIDRQSFSHTASPPYVLRLQRGPYQYWFENFMPSTNHVRLVRLLVKHVHNFVNTAKPEVVSSPYQSQITSTLDEFKKSLIPYVIQKKLYTFLRHGFDRWPLDCSFRLLLETWLTYIQPWRYIYSKSQTGCRDSDVGDNKTVEEKWFPFVEDNLLFYTVLYQEFTQRVFRMDLTTQFNACMLYRANKVYSLPNLSNMVFRAEREMCNAIRLGRPGSHDLGGSYISPEASLSLHSQISELEKPGFQYCRMYSEEMIQMMKAILGHIEVAKQTLVAYEESINRTRKSGLAAIFDVSSWFQDDQSMGDMSPSEVKKVQSYLDTAASNICYIFEIETHSFPSKQMSSPNQFEQSSFLESSLLSNTIPDCEETEEGFTLTPHGRYQLKNKMRKFDVVYQGDPDLQPIRSFENATLVRLLHQFCNFVNTQYGQDIQNLCDRTDLIGRMAQVYFAPPLPLDSKLNSPISSTQKRALQRPRLSLRLLASYRTLVYLGLFYLILTLWWGVGLVGFCFFVIGLVLLYGFLFAMIHRSKVKMN